MNDFKIGLVVDFNNYKEYYEKFAQKYEKEILEFHILEKDLENFAEKIAPIELFLKNKNIKHLAFHCPDRLSQSVLFEEKSGNFKKDKSKFYDLVDNLKKLSDELNQEIIFVVHQGIKISKNSLNGKTNEEIDLLRDYFLQKAKESYKILMNYASNSKLRPMLENSPPSCATDSDIHFIDLCFEDIEPRIGANGFVLDLSHAAMCIKYFKQDEVKFAALESLRRKYNGIPESLQSLDKYLHKAAKNIHWIHVNDANGIFGENEGLAIGVDNSIIPLDKTIKTIKEKIINPLGVLEIVNSHKDYNLIKKSMDKLTSSPAINYGDSLYEK